MTRLHVGCRTPRTPGQSYFRALPFVELAPRGPLPKPSTLRKWRESLPAEALVSLVVPRQAVFGVAGVLRRDVEVDGTLEWLAAASASVRARLVVLRTPPELTPGPRDRDMLAEFIRALRKKSGKATLVWRATGLWKAREAASVARKLEVIAGVDPFEDGLVPGALAYAELEAAGGRRRFSLERLESLLEAFRQVEVEEGFVVFDSPDAWREARRLVSVMKGEAAQEEDEDETDDKAGDDDGETDDKAGDDDGGDDEEEDDEEEDDEEEDDEEEDDEEEDDDDGDDDD